MTSLTIRHVTTYRYRQPVAFGEHRMMLRPRESHDQKIIEASLGITPQPSRLRFVEDDFGNHVAIAEFTGQATELSFESVVSLEHSPSDTAALDLEDAARIFPVDYTGSELPEVADCLQRRHPDPENEIGRWAGQFLHAGGRIGTLELLTRLSQGIQQGFLYRRREAKGIQAPLETLRLGHGCCRDFALLMIEAARALGFAGRFASGYLAIPIDQPVQPGMSPAVGSSQGDTPHGATHAWAQVYLPGAGWVDFDPTCGSVGKSALVTVAVVRDPDHALPLHGTFIGAATDPLGMEVRVSVTSGSG
jgi:transglutaminase-like putative cysteine protease